MRARGARPFARGLPITRLCSSPHSPPSPHLSHIRGEARRRRRQRNAGPRGLPPSGEVYSRGRRAQWREEGAIQVSEFRAVWGALGAARGEKALETAPPRLDQPCVSLPAWPAPCGAGPAPGNAPSKGAARSRPASAGRGPAHHWLGSGQALDGGDGAAPQLRQPSTTCPLGGGRRARRHRSFSRAGQRRQRGTAVCASAIHVTHHLQQRWTLVPRRTAHGAPAPAYLPARSAGPFVTTCARLLPRRDRLLYTLVCLAIFLVCSQLPLYGVKTTTGADPLYWARVIMASSRGTVSGCSPGAALLAVPCVVPGGGGPTRRAQRAE